MYDLTDITRNNHSQEEKEDNEPRMVYNYKVPVIGIYLTIFVIIIVFSTSLTWRGASDGPSTPSSSTEQTEPTSEAKNLTQCYLESDLRINISRRLRSLAKTLKNMERGEWVGMRPLVEQVLQQVLEQLDPRVALAYRRDRQLDVNADCWTGSASAQPSPLCRIVKRPLAALLTAVHVAPPRPAGKDPLAPLRVLHPYISSLVAVTKHVKYNVSYNSRVFPSRRKELHTPGKLLNRLMTAAQTPFVLIVRDAARVDGLARLERLVRKAAWLGMNGEASAGVVGGAVRDPLGHWSAGCAQTRLRHYALRMRPGYRYSALDCMLCDHLRGPFVVHTDLVRKVQFSETLHGEAMFTDWFLRVKKQRVFVASCPDSLFFVKGAAEQENQLKEEREDAGLKEATERSMWWELARKWEFDHVLLPGRPPLRFSCYEAMIDCHMWTKSRGDPHAMPRCCLEEAVAALKAIDLYASRHDLQYELQHASLLGAVKSRSLMASRYHGTLGLSEQWRYHLDHYKQMNLSVSPVGSMAISFVGFLRTPQITFNYYFTPWMSTQQLPKEVRATPTRVNVMGAWIRAPAEPGAYARFLMGKGYLKHSCFHRDLLLSDEHGNEFVLIP